ncbi:MAG: ankyrin repeat domain-containing protein, partial [Phaeodactylibacter sp.]|nr:ankyrin repeat domain-containing protein [Phaeodactylibacter sp.]
LLLDNGADVHHRDTFGDPALNWAAYYGHIGYANVLLRYGASWDVQSRNGSALDIAAQQWHLDLLDFFIGKGAGTPLETEAEKALLRSIKQGRVSETRQWLDKGGSPNQADELGTPVLLWAAANGREEIVELLLSRGASPDVSNRAGYTPLGAAARFGHTAIASRLLDFGAGSNAAGAPYHITPLMCAAMGGHAGIGELLLNSGASIDVQDTNDGFTALMYATAEGHKDMVRLLIRYRANPYIKSHDGTGLYELVSYAADPELAKIIESYVMSRQ